MYNIGPSQQRPAWATGSSEGPQALRAGQQHTDFEHLPPEQNLLSHSAAIFVATEGSLRNKCMLFGCREGDGGRQVGSWMTRQASSLQAFYTRKQ